MTDIAISARDVDVIIGKTHILKSVDVEIPRGKVVGLLGPSGAGKSTLIRTLAGLQKITAGSLSVSGMPAGHKDLRGRIGYMAQDPDIYMDLTVAENIRYFASLINADDLHIGQLIEDVELEPQIHQLASTLSGGQVARLSMLVALLGRPDIIILDEPTVGLDPILRAKLWGEFRALAAEDNTVLITSHVMDEAQRCDHLILIHDGEVLASDSPKQLIHKTNTKTMEDAFIAIIGATDEN